MRNEKGLLGDETAPEIKKMLLSIVRSMVDRPDDVQITTVLDQEDLVFRLLVHDSDKGRLIGKNGQTARALQTVLGAASMKIGRKFILEIVK